MKKTRSETPGQRVATGALEQEAARVFRRLTETSAYLAQLGGHLRGGDEYGVFVSRNNFKKAVMKVNADMFDGFVAKDWIEKTPAGHWWITAQGEAWLRRRMAAHDPFRIQHQLMGSKNIEINGGSRRKLTVNLSESPLGWLLHRKGAGGKALLTQEQYDAGERLRSDFEKAQMSPSITADMSMPILSTNKRSGNSGNGISTQEAAIAAKARFFKALEAVGPDLSDVLIEVCCHLRGMDEAEKHLHLPQRSGKIVLQIALTRLGQHYGMIASKPAHHYRLAALRHWGDEGYRPKI